MKSLVAKAQEHMENRVTVKMVVTKLKDEGPFFLFNFLWKRNTPVIEDSVENPTFLPGTPKNQFFYGCFNWMIPNLYIGNGWKSPNIHLKDGCVGYQVDV